MPARRHPGRRLSVAIALSVVGLLSGSAPAGRAAHRSPAVDGLAERYYPEVRLRKLHLVRPDLIPYPISFEVYC